jgi:hypothetical protein
MENFYRELVTACGTGNIDRIKAVWEKVRSGATPFSAAIWSQREVILRAFSP